MMNGVLGLCRCQVGSVADRVVRGASVPVLLVQAAKEKNWGARSRYSYIIQHTAQPSS